jgi:hypothetical protein
MGSWDFATDWGTCLRLLLFLASCFMVITASGWWNIMNQAESGDNPSKPKLFTDFNDVTKAIYILYWVCTLVFFGFWFYQKKRGCIQGVALDWIGIAILAGAIFGWGIYSLIKKPLRPRYTMLIYGGVAGVVVLSFIGGDACSWLMEWQEKRRRAVSPGGDAP